MGKTSPYKFKHVQPSKNRKQKPDYIKERTWNYDAVKQSLTVRNKLYFSI